MHQMQLSQEEWLLLSGLARLPLALAMGDKPTAGYDQSTLGAALMSATGGLMARGVLLPSSGDSPPPLAEGVAELPADSALAQSALMCLSRAGNRIDTRIYTWHNGAMIRHTRPADRLHRLERLPTTALLAELLALIDPPESVADAAELTLPSDVLSTATDAAAAGQIEVARRALLQADAPEAATARLAEQLDGVNRKSSRG